MAVIWDCGARGRPRALRCEIQEGRGSPRPIGPRARAGTAGARSQSRIQWLAVGVGRVPHATPTAPQRAIILDGVEMRLMPSGVRSHKGREDASAAAAPRVQQHLTTRLAARCACGARALPLGGAAPLPPLRHRAHLAAEVIGSNTLVTRAARERKRGLCGTPLSAQSHRAPPPPPPGRKVKTYSC